MEIFYIEADRWMTGGATRGTGQRDNYEDREQTSGEKGREGLQLYTTVDRLAVADVKREKTERCERKERQVMSNRDEKGATKGGLK